MLSFLLSFLTETWYYYCSHFSDKETKGLVPQITQLVRIMDRARACLSDLKVHVLMLRPLPVTFGGLSPAAWVFLGLC